MSEESAVLGVEILFDERHPIARYITTADNFSPRLTHDLVDQIIRSIDPDEVDQQSLMAGVGQAPDLAARTLQLISDQLHAFVHGLGSSVASGDTRSSEPS